LKESKSVSSTRSPKPKRTTAKTPSPKNKGGEGQLYSRKKNTTAVRLFYRKDSGGDRPRIKNREGVTIIRKRVLGSHEPELHREKIQKTAKATAKEERRKARYAGKRKTP